MPDLNYTTPLYTFDSTHLSYTATKESYLMGGIGSGDDSSGVVVYINDTTISPNMNTRAMEFISPLKLKSGDVVTVRFDGSYSRCSLKVYELAN